MAVVYKHTSPDGKIYIGISHTDDLKYISKNRWQAKGQGYRNNKPFWDDIQKYGWDNFKHDILEIGITNDDIELKHIEASYIREYESDKPEKGYNKKSAYRSVRCIESNKIYLSIKEASRDTGIWGESIQSCCAGRLKTAGKLHWEYVE